MLMAAQLQRRGVTRMERAEATSVHQRNIASSLRGTAAAEGRDNNNKKMYEVARRKFKEAKKIRRKSMW